MSKIFVHIMMFPSIYSLSFHLVYMLYMKLNKPVWVELLSIGPSGIHLDALQFNAFSIKYKYLYYKIIWIKTKSFFPAPYKLNIPECHGSEWVSRPLPVVTSTVYWCIASKLKAARNLYWMGNMFLWAEIFLFFVCYHVFPKRHSQLDYELNRHQTMLHNFLNFS